MGSGAEAKNALRETLSRALNRAKMMHAEADHRDCQRGDFDPCPCKLSPKTKEALEEERRVHKLDIELIERLLADEVLDTSAEAVTKRVKGGLVKDGLLQQDFFVSMTGDLI